MTNNLFNIIKDNINNTIIIFNKNEQALLNDSNFINEIDQLLKDILEDNKINLHDIPKIVLLLSKIVIKYVNIYNNINIFNIIQFIIESILYLYNKVLSPEDKQLFNDIMLHSIELLKMEVNLLKKKCNFSCFCKKRI